MNLLYHRFGVARRKTDVADPFFEGQIEQVVQGTLPQGEIERKRLIRQAPAQPDFFPQGFPVGKTGDGYLAETARVRDRRRQPGVSQVGQAALHDGPLDAKETGKARFYHFSPAR